MTRKEQNKMLDDKIESNISEYKVDRLNAEISAFSSGDLNKYEFLTREDLKYKPNALDKARFEFSPLGKAFSTRLDKTIPNYQQEGVIKLLKDVRDSLVGDNRPNNRSNNRPNNIPNNRPNNDDNDDNDDNDRNDDSNDDRNDDRNDDSRPNDDGSDDNKPNDDRNDNNDDNDNDNNDDNDNDDINNDDNDKDDYDDYKEFNDEEKLEKLGELDKRFKRLINKKTFRITNIFKRKK